MRRMLISAALVTLVDCGPSPAAHDPGRLTTATATVPLAAEGSDAAPPPAVTAGPPPTPRRASVDEYLGHRVTDDYRWLEDGADPAVAKWSDDQNRFARSTLDALPHRDAIRARVTALMSQRSPDWTDLQHRPGALFAMKEQPPKQHPFLVVMKTPEDARSERVVVDPNDVDSSGGTAIDFYAPSRDGKLVCVSMSRGGSESGDVHVYDVATGRARGDVVPRVNGGTAGGSVAWNADASGFYYTRYPREGERPSADLGFYQQIYFHKLGTPTSQDRYELGKEFPRIAETHLASSDDGKYVLATVENGDGKDFAHWLLSPAGTWLKLADFADKVFAAKFGRDGRIYLLSALGSPRGKILRVSPRAPSLARAEVVVPESDVVIEDFEVTASKLYVVDLVGGPSELRVFALDGGGRAPTKLPLLAVSSVGQVAALDGDEVLVRNQSYLEPPAWYRVGRGAAQRTPLAVTSSADFRDTEVVRETCTSKDGTKVPMSVLHKSGARLDGSNPTLLTGYGGFGNAQVPRFRPQWRTWIEQGGVYAVANLRGGSEFGEDWHRAGKTTKKQNVFDDFAACAERLIERGFTRPERLATTGGSNGGLLMGAMLTQHPERVRAVVSFVGIYDMLRLEHDPNGAFNVTEYGSTKDAAELDAFLAYSPYHHVQNGTPYPSVLLLTGANDPRVEPYHSRKMVARLQAATASKNPVLLRTSGDTGHGIGSPLRAQIEELTDVYSFLFHELGVAYAAP